MSSAFQSNSREQRLDFWRGLCLIDMVLVHLYYQNVQFGDFLGRLLGDYTRFAAGGFIFVSGLSIGVIFWPRALDERKRASTYKKLWRRAIYILVINYVSALVLICIDLLQGNRGNFVNPLALLRDLFFFREGGDLLPFYVVMIAVSPFIMQALRRKWGWLMVLVASVSLFVWGLWHPWVFAIPATDRKFPPVLWQAIFTLGLLLGYAWPKYNAITFKWKSIMAAGCWLLAGILFVMEYSYQWGMPQLSFGTAFTKVPLSTPEALRYLSITFGIITTTDLVWAKIGSSAPAAFAQTLGKKSLPVYVVHLWIIQLAGYLAAQWPNMGAWQLIFAPIAVLILWLFALILDITAKPKKAHIEQAGFPVIFTPESLPSAAR